MDKLTYLRLREILLYTALTPYLYIFEELSLYTLLINWIITESFEEVQHIIIPVDLSLRLIDMLYRTLRSKAKAMEA